MQHEQLTPEEIRDAEDTGLTAGAVPTERGRFHAERVEHYRARGEDYGTAYAWAELDTTNRFGGSR